MKKPNYILVRKAKRPNAPWYVRKYDKGVRTDINLGTPDRKLAELELMRVKLAAEEMERHGIVGDPTEALKAKKTELSEPIASPSGILEKWETHMRVSGLREASVYRYVKAARRLVGNVSPASLTPSAVANIMASTVNLKNNTRHGYVNALQNLFSFMKRPDLSEALPNVKSEQTDRVWWTKEQMDEIIKHVSCDTAEHTLEYMDFFKVMATVGSRQGETAELRWCDVKTPGILYFRAETTKSRKEKMVPIPFSLWAQLEVRRPKNDSDPQFLDESDTRPVFPHIRSVSQASRYSVLSRALKKVGLTGGLHTFRHSVAVLLYGRANCDIKSVAQILGHSPQVSLLYYQHARTVDDLRSIVEDMQD